MDEPRVAAEQPHPVAHNVEGGLPLPGRLARRLCLRDLEIPLLQLLVSSARLLLEFPAAELGAEPDPEHGKIAGLGNVVVGAGVETLEDGLAFPQACQHDHRDRAPGGRRLDAPAHLVPGHFRHHQIEQNAVHRAALEQRQRLGARTGRHHVVVVLPQFLGHHMKVSRAVIDSQNGRLGPASLAAAAALCQLLGPDDHLLPVIGLARILIGPNAQFSELPRDLRFG